MEDGIIVDMYLSRNEKAISNTQEKYGQRLRNLAFRILDDILLAEECENDTYMEAWNMIPPHEPREYLFPFLARITRHLALNIHRKNNAIKRKTLFVDLTSELEECLPSSGSPESEAEADALADEISTFLGTLTEEQRGLFMRRYWYFDSVSELAVRFRWSNSKVKTTLFRIREKLKNHLKKEGYTI